MKGGASEEKAAGTEFYWLSFSCLIHSMQRCARLKGLEGKRQVDGKFANREVGEESGCFELLKMAEAWVPEGTIQEP